ncbi:S26 family signal peptidase [Pelagibacterium halotolerans]|uniref:S26 family signal peptidase n=1 Tax=Pelagibacterium halotolerans TaxID=531813 RepID=UPI00384F2591
MSWRRITITAMFAGVALLAVPAWLNPAPRYIWNASASVPIGLYRVEPATRIEVTDLVAVMPPDALANYLDTRGYLPRGVPMIKRVLALSGTTVCRRGTTIFAYDHAYGEARQRDNAGRDLPIWQGCRMLRDSEVFLMNWDAPDSFDGRYFGALPMDSVIARVVPVWTGEDGDGCFRWRAGDNPTAP